MTNTGQIISSQNILNNPALLAMAAGLQQQVGAAYIVSEVENSCFSIFVMRKSRKKNGCGHTRLLFFTL
jgi:hypothetical protein